MPELKLSSNQAIDLLKTLGVQVAEISAEDNPEFKPDEAIATIDGARRKILEPQILEAHKEKLTSETMGRMAGTLRTLVARKTGISKAELEGLKDEEMIEKGLAHYESKMGQDTEGLREEMKKMAESHKNSLTKRESELLAKVEEAENKYKSHFVIESLAEEIKDLTLTEGTDRIYAAKLLHRELQERAHINFDESTKKTFLRDKTNHELPLYNEGKTAELKSVDIANEIFGRLGMLQKNMTGTPPKGFAGGGLTKGGNGKAPEINAPSAVGNVDLVALAQEHWKQ